MAAASRELSFRVPLERLTTTPAAYAVVAGAAERAAIAARFGLIALDRLEAALDLRRVGGGAAADGRLVADAVQSCVVSLAPVPAHIDVPVHFRFAAPAGEGADIELSGADLDVLAVEDGAVDLGEALAQALAVALDPYPHAGAAELAEARAFLMTEEQAAAQEQADRMAKSPFARLKG